jgi:hypothetical protein
MKTYIPIDDDMREELIKIIREMYTLKFSVNLDDLIVIPTASVSQFTGLTQKTVQRRFPITSISTQKQGVILSIYKEYLRNNTRHPK